MMVEESCFDELDRSLLNISATMAGFFSWSYGIACRLITPLDPNQFDSATSKAKEIGTRILIALGVLVASPYILLTAVVLGVGSKIFRGVGFYFQKNGFTHIRGTAPEITLVNGQATIMTCNVQDQRGGAHYAHGALHWRSHIEQIIDNIQKENPDVIVLQNAYETAQLEALVDELADQYAHFYIHLGPNTWGDESGCMVITKCAVHDFSHTSFANNDADTNRGFEVLEIKASPTDLMPCARIIGTQLTPGKEAREKRTEQVAQIVNTLAKQKAAMPSLLVGSLSIDRDSKESEDLLSKYLYHSYLDNALDSQSAPTEIQEESSDFISLFKRNLCDGRILPVVEKNIRLLNSHLVKGFENSDTCTARSDSHAVVTSLAGLKAVAAIK